MIMDRMTQRMKKLFDNGEIQYYQDEATKMVLIVQDESNMYTEAASVIGIDPDSGEVGQIYVDWSLTHDIDAEMYKHITLALRMVEHGQM